MMRTGIVVAAIGLVLGATVHAGETGQVTAIRGGTILTITQGSIEDGVVLIRDGVIAEIGSDVAIPDGARVIEAQGMFVMPGIIDAHSHIALGDVNEATSPSTPQVRILDELVPDDESLVRALAGGVTAAKLMHGSANVIGGLSATVKLKVGSSAEEMLIPGIRQQLKLALGENPKRVYGERGRMPATRAGIFAILRERFTAAREYAESWRRHEERAAGGAESTPPRRDLELETLAAVLAGEIAVDVHCYVAHEIVTFLKFAEEFGLEHVCLSHALEAYKVADVVADAGVHVLTHTDWWGFKWETYDAIPYQPGMLHQIGIPVSIVSDSGDVIRRLPGEAAKVVKYSGLDDDAALAMITINPARALEIDHLTGSLEVGKHADVAIFNGHPLDSFSRCVMTMIEGEVFFDELDPAGAGFSQGGQR